MEEFINDGGRVLTIRCLILEANKVCLIDLDGKTLSAKVIGYDGDTGKVIGYDGDTGFGIVQAFIPLKAELVSLGNPGKL